MTARRRSLSPLRGRSSIRARAVVAVLLTLTVALIGATAGNSSSTGQAGAEDASATTPWVREAKAAVQKGYGTGMIQPPPTTGPEAQRGKNIWWISCGRVYSTCVVQDNAFKAAGKALGWKVTVVDGKSSAPTAAALIRQAVAAKADAIGMDAYDCAGIKAALQAAKRAGIPTISFAGYDCKPSLFTALPKIVGTTSPSGLFTVFGSMIAKYAIAAENGKGSILYVTCIEKDVCKAINRGYDSAMAKCRTCKNIRVPYTFSQVPNPANQIWKSAILAHPEANALAYVPSGLMSLGLQTIVKSSAKKLRVYGAEGGDANFENIRTGLELSAIVRQDEQAIWATADTINRILAGANPKTLPNQGGGIQVVDKTHNLPPKGKPYKAAFDYKTAYTKVWNG
jgi:ribose transport system substrate-binding protein